MLLVQKAELDARLRCEFAGMDIRDLIKADASSSANISGFSHLLKRNHSAGNIHPSPGFAPNALPLPYPSPKCPNFDTTSPSDSPGFPPHNSLLLQNHENNYYAQGSQPAHSIVQQPHNMSSSHSQQTFEWPRYFAANKRSSPPGDANEGPPMKKSSTKWNPEENKQIIRLRGQGMKWSDISRHIPGRTGLACRLHYQNYLEKRGEWDEERKNKLARVYERMKEEMWKPVAAELGIPWRTAEGMHWIIGEQEMARRANVHPFSSTIQPSSSTAMSAPSSNGRPRKPYRPCNPTIDFSDYEVAALQSPGVSPASGGPVSTFPPSLTQPDGSAIQSLRSRVDFVPRDHFIDLGEAHSREPLSMDIKLSNGLPSSALQGQIQDIAHSTMSNTAPNLLPSIAELEGGVSPFGTEYGRRGSASSGGSGSGMGGNSSANSTSGRSITRHGNNNNNHSHSNSNNNGGNNNNMQMRGSENHIGDRVNGHHRP